MDKRFKIFQLVWELRSFSAAAAFLGMSQPNATQQIKKLEEELGIRLFDRDTRSLKLTAAGKAVLEELPRWNAATECLQRKLSELRTGIRSYALGGTLTAGNFVLPPLMAEFMRRNPKITLHLAVENTVRITEKIQQGFLDLALVEGPFEKSLFRYRKFSDDELIATGCPELLGGDFSLVEHLKRGGRLLLREPGSGTRHYFDRFCLEHDIAVPAAQIIAIQSFEAIKELACRGLGVTFLSPLAGRVEREQGRLLGVPMREGRILREFNFIASRDADVEFTGKFMDFCEETYRTLGEAFESGSVIQPAAGLRRRSAAP